LELPAHRQLRVRMGSRSLYRPALLSEADQGRNSHDQLSEVSQLFVSAGYSWKEPLSARSYSSWRRRLSHKRDQVTLINGQQPSESLYMIRTDTSEGLLRTASLAIRRNDLHPMEGSFQFVGAETVTISDTEVDMPETSIRPETSRSRNTSARQLSAADALHVLEALHRAGVDVGEDIEVLDNPTHTQFVLSASGIDALTRSAIQKDLKIHSQIPVIWEQPGAGVKTTAAFASEALRSDHRMSPEIRGHLEQLLGGPDQLESVTNQSLDLAGELLASAHALYVLAQRVPYSAESTLSEPDRQLMGRLREDYLTAVANRFAELGRLLMPVIQTESIRADGDSPRQDWRKNTPILLQHAQNLNRDLAQLLAGSYTRPEGEALLQRIPATAASLKRSLDNPVGKAP
jgi:hypothetical protein